MDLADIVRDMLAAGPPEEPVVKWLLSPVRWSLAALEQAGATIAAAHSCLLEPSRLARNFHCTC